MSAAEARHQGKSPGEETSSVVPDDVQVGAMYQQFGNAYLKIDSYINGYAYMHVCVCVCVCVCI